MSEEPAKSLRDQLQDIADIERSIGGEIRDAVRPILDRLISEKVLPIVKLETTPASVYGGFPRDVNINVCVELRPTPSGMNDLRGVLGLNLLTSNDL